jgi:two-component system OmpR family response regulator
MYYIYIASHLQTEHIDAYTQPSGEAALKLLEKQRVDIVVVDCKWLAI